MASKIKEFIKINYPKDSYHTSYVPTSKLHSSGGPEFLSWIGNIAKDIFKNEHSGINILLRGIGLDALETRNYGFGDDIASEIAVLNPSSINLIAKINNPMMSKEQIKEIDWYQSPEYAAQQAEKRKLRSQEEKEREEHTAKLRQYLDENRTVYELTRQLLREKKFDEADKIKQDFKNKWRGFQPE